MLIYYKNNGYPLGISDLGQKLLSSLSSSLFGKREIMWWKKWADKVCYIQKNILEYGTHISFSLFVGSDMSLKQLLMKVCMKKNGRL